MKPYGAMTSTEYAEWYKAGGTNPSMTSASSALVVVEPPVIHVPPLGAATVSEKAVTGLGASYLTYSQPLSSMARTPQQKAYSAAKLYWDNYLVRMAERPVSSRAGAVPWHLENSDQEEVGTDEGQVSDPAMLAIRDLLMYPQKNLEEAQRQPGMGTWRGMMTLVLRHMGLAGTSFLYLDQTEALAGTPLSILYLAPWRLFPVYDQRTGRVIGATIDKSMDDGGAPIDLVNVLPFHLEPPDMGIFATGFVEAFGAKAMLDPIIDRHIGQVIGSGGRLTGLISPKAGTTVTDGQWSQFVADYRNITSDPNAALKLQIVQGPVDFVRTAASLDELAIVEIDERTRDAALALWGVPRSQAAIASPAGLNSGSAKGFDEAVLWQGAIHPRIDALRETIQTGLLDRYKALGTDVTLVFEEPSFDDETPAYDLAVKANQAGVPLKNKERRGLVGLEPFGDNIKDDQGRIIDDIVLLPSLVTDAFYANLVQPPPPPPPVVVAAPPPQRLLPAQAAGKALIGRNRFMALRRTVDNSAVPRLRSAVQGVLTRQRDAVVAHLRRVGLDTLKRKRDLDWQPRREDRALAQALSPHLGRIADKVARKTHAVLSPGKATVDEFSVAVTDRVLRGAGSRITGINETTLKVLRETVAEALEDAATIDDIIQAVQDLGIWNPDRAEVIARTESMFAYNDAALGSYAEMGIEQVQAIDGDEDEECAERDGQVFDVDEAESIQDHPNGTLDWMPVVPDEEPVPQKSDLSAIIEAVKALLPAPVPGTTQILLSDPRYRTVIDFAETGEPVGEHLELIA